MNKATVTARPGEQNIIIERVFDAPRDKVFAAMTQKDKVEQWWIGPGYDVRVESLDVRAGGSWKFVQSNKEGQEFSFHGVFHYISPECIIQTTEFDGMPEPGHVGLEKMELFDLGNGKTKLVSTGTFMSLADRDGMLQSGMEEGVQQTYARLEEVLQGMH
ncbi:MAG: SRPBCC family protein [Ktedonobacteraceae bacterium]|nr:SRPBCC family protein [Ktedonobacteraceae bacterium]